MENTSKELSKEEPIKEESEVPSFGIRIRRFLFGGPQDLRDRTLFRRIALIPFLAWVGLGADGLSSSSYGPEEAFRTFGQHTYLALPLVFVTAFTVFLISTAYSRIIEKFPYGGGGYVVATKLLGRRVGVVSGCALLVDYFLTITVSISAAGDALFSFLPLAWHGGKLPLEFLFISGLTLLNIRGVKESVLSLTPIFALFILTHILLIGGIVIGNLSDVPVLAQDLKSGFEGGLSSLGSFGLILLFVYAYSLGGGTYTGLEAVSNGLPIMREPKVETAKRTMRYMASSLAFTAAGLLLCYLLIRAEPMEGKTLNAILAEGFAPDSGWGPLFVVLTLLTEALLLIVGSQTGFIDGPRVMANMAIDSWFPRRLISLSERLTMQNGILIMAFGSLAALFYTKGDVHHLIVMYSINVFLTFSLSMLSMLRYYLREREREQDAVRMILLFGTGLVFCSIILIVTILVKFPEGGWITLLVTGSLIAFCFAIRKHYSTLSLKMQKLERTLSDLPFPSNTTLEKLDPSKPTAGILVVGYGGLGIHTTFNIFRFFGNYFKNLVFISIGVIDSGEFKGEGSVEALRERTEGSLKKFEDLARRLGIPSTYRMEIGTDPVEKAEELCHRVAKEFPRITFFAGQVIFQRERWYQRILHNETAFDIQKRLHWEGLTMVILPVRIR